MQSLQREHFALMIKYIGISFITWAISHGFFSGQRQIITAFVGIFFFVIGTVLLKKDWEEDFLKTIILSALLAVSIWALTWWLQHFPDSPERSVWIVPLGFIFSYLFYVIIESKNIFNKALLSYGIGWFIVMIVLSWVLYEAVKTWILAPSDNHHEVIVEKKQTTTYSWSEREQGQNMQPKEIDIKNEDEHHAH